MATETKTSIGYFLWYSSGPEFVVALYQYDKRIRGTQPCTIILETKTKYSLKTHTYFTNPWYITIKGWPDLRFITKDQIPFYELKYNMRTI